MLEIKKVFISGPMSGYPNMNKEAFMEAEKELRAAGFSVFNPAWLLDCTGFEEDDFMAIDLAALSRCNYIYQLDGWEDSKGARAEYMSAAWAGLEIINHIWLNWYLEEKEKRLKDFDEKFEENRMMRQQAAIQMNEEQQAKYMKNILMSQINVARKDLL